MADKKTTKGKGSDPQGGVAEEETENLYTLGDLTARLGAATEAEVGEYIEGMTKASLIEAGAEVATNRIDKDTARLYGKAADFFDQAKEEQLDVLLGVSPDLLRIAVWAAHQGSARAEAREKGMARAGASKQARGGAAEAVRARAVARRKSLRAGLRVLAAGDPATLTTIEAAYGNIASPKATGDALEALAKVGREMLKNPSAGLASRLKTSRLTKALLDDTQELARDVRATGDAAGAVASIATVPQTEVDYWDGINLYFLGTFMDVFESGNEVDPTIPRLVPISLRKYFTPARRTPEAAKPVGE